MFSDSLWHGYFKRPIDTLDGRYWYEVRADIRKYFFQCEWNEVYDFVEFVVSRFPDKASSEGFIYACNKVLEQEVSGYRVVGEKVVEITSSEEMNEVETALESLDSLAHVALHLKRSLDLLANRESPDYRNSIKESVSAVEAICKVIVGDSKATLGQALRVIESQESFKVHPALSGAFSKLYGYTNDANGIRHSMSDGSDVSFEDAKFMLVSCSAFVNYLKVKASKAGAQL